APTGEPRRCASDPTGGATRAAGARQRQQSKAGPLMASTLSSTVDMTAGTPTPIGRLELPQYSLRQILAVWLAAAVPMSILGWAIAPWLSDRIGGRDAFLDALLICFNVGLIWMIALVLIMVSRA